MAKFLAALLGCTLRSKGSSPMLEGTIFSTLAGEKSSSDYKKEQQWKPVYYSLATMCLSNPLIEKPGGKIPNMSVLSLDIFVHPLKTFILPCCFVTLPFPRPPTSPRSFSSISNLHQQDWGREKETIIFSAINLDIKIHNSITLFTV
ncbi:rCG37966, isoform CRA_a [Rattus norvegicus]|uniref:RCG37966, isoform CRA_a n=1 Tax=Rattus norvegicus TaxID=10116 RepID=A6K631_RAT|nr:rCG37966, isoform CRA_a [Rattus norvegicus]